MKIEKEDAQPTQREIPQPARQPVTAPAPVKVPEKVGA